MQVRRDPIAGLVEQRVKKQLKCLVTLRPILRPHTEQNYMAGAQPGVH